MNETVDPDSHLLAMNETVDPDSHLLTMNETVDPDSEDDQASDLMSPPKRVCSGGTEILPTKKDIFSASTSWRGLGDGGSDEVSSAISGVTRVASQMIREPTRRSYTQVYNQIKTYAATLSPPVKVDITAASIPPAIIISFFRVLFTGKGKPVLGDNDIPLEAKDGKTRLGRGYSESTFRKYFHALNTLHKHFQRESTIGLDENGEHTGNSCLEPSVTRVYKGYLKMFHDPIECARYGRQLEAPIRAWIFKVSDFLAIQQTTRKQPSGYNLRSWTYLLLSCALFLRKSEAANLTLRDIEIPTNPVSGEILTVDGLPKYIYIHIRRSKTDQAGEGRRLLLRRNMGDVNLCPIIALMTWLIVLKRVYGCTSASDSLFPNLSRGRVGNMLEKENFRKMLHTIVSKAEITTPGLRTHSCRRTAAYYAAWLGIPETTIKILGRWDSQVYQQYVETADIDKREWEDTKSPDDSDPIAQHFNIFGHN